MRFKKLMFIKFLLLCLLGFHVCEAALNHTLNQLGTEFVRRPVHVATRNISLRTRFFGGIDGQQSYLQKQHARFNNYPIDFAQDQKILDQLKAFTALPQTAESKLFYLGPRTVDATHLAVAAAYELASQKKRVLFLTSSMYNYFQNKCFTPYGLFPENHLRHLKGYDVVVINGIYGWPGWYEDYLLNSTKVYLTHLLRDEKNTKIIISAGKPYEHLVSELVTDGHIVPQDKNSLKTLLYNKS